ncbi:MAG: hypothetical protein ABS87_01630 [Sphingomonas sp. SCN 67-18]|uniref:c-type cytochrome n=1 Tax=uncultured Sphingomonas sp. TaxID=158754 RepID=UPI000869B119|nr:c-type cytochrome [Sphingomonas sp. SCN 67-18]ODU22592.1 MAG: hypothetical protein ABS87_01630 [Sphingomonas sp. SCN 67-18]
MRKFHYCLLALSLPAYAALSQDDPGVRIDKTTFHYNIHRTGWNDKEKILTPEAVASHRFGLLWESPELDRYEGREPRLQASPLYLDSVTMGEGPYNGKRFSVAYLASTNGYVYAVNTAPANGVAPGAILWRAKLAEKPCGNATEMIGILSTPIIDLGQNRIYVSACDAGQWSVHALDVRSGKGAPNWPLAIDAKNVNRPGVIKNGTAFPSVVNVSRGAGWWQRGALNLSPDKSRLYLSFGKDGQSGWLVSVDTRQARVASAFSTTQITDQMQGGMWASGGPAVDPQGRVYISTGASFLVAVTMKLGLKGVYSESPNSWGQSILQLRDDPRSGFQLTGTYTPFNYCHAVSKDIDLGSSGPIVVDLPGASSTTPRLLAFGGGKQGNFYLLNRDKMPGSLEQRHACTDDSASDMSLLDPDPQPQFNKRGPINLFGPYSEDIGMLNSAKSRSTAAYFSDGEGNHYVFASGSSKKGADFSTPTAPGVARVRLVTRPGEAAHPKLDQLEGTQTLFNPGSPVVTSNGGKDAIVWVMDPNAPRLASMYGPRAPRPTLYAFDAKTLRLLWKSGPDDLFTGGKYNEPAVVNGIVLVGTDRLQAFGIRATSAMAYRRTGEGNPGAPVAQAAPMSPGAAIFEERCAGCHTGGSAPTPRQLAAFTQERIVASLTHGVMAPVAAGMTKEQIEQVAVYIRTAPQEANE